MLEGSTKDAASFGELTQSFDNLFELIKCLDSEQSNDEIRFEDKIGTFEKLKKTSGFIDQKIQEVFLTRFGFRGIHFENMEDVYAPQVTGISSLEKTRSYLLKNGMSGQFADILAAKYIKKIEQNSTILPIMELFNNNTKVVNLLEDCSFEKIPLNYQTIQGYTQSLYQSNLPLQHLKPSATRAPNMAIRPTMRMFSTDDKKSGFFDFLRQDEPEAAQETPKEQEDLKTDEIKFEGT